MSRDTPRNVSASIRDHLLRLSKERGEDFQAVLTRYANERLLYRLSISPYHGRFILKGAKLFEIWTGEVHRPTRDIDFLGFGSPVVDDVVDNYREICTQPVPVDDGLVFDPDSIIGYAAREDQEYQGVSLKLDAFLATARVQIQIDFGFGDAITPGAGEATIGTLIDLPAPVLRIYPRETVVAEKFQAMVALGITNSRMKDFYDIWYLAQRFAFNGNILRRAISATFGRRQTDVPSELPLALTAEFYGDPVKQQQWDAFIRRSRLGGDGTNLQSVISCLCEFLMPPARAAGSDELFNMHWIPASGNWHPDSVD